MSDFKAALGNFLAGKLDFAGLEAALASCLQADPGAAQEIAQLIETTYRARRLPPQLYSLLKARIAAAGVAPAVPPAAPPAEPADRTQVRPPPPSEDVDRTRIQSPPQAAQPAPAAPEPTGEITIPHAVPGAPPEVTAPTGAPSPAPPEVTALTGVPPAAPSEVTAPTGGTAQGGVTGRTSPTSGATSSWGDLQQASAQEGQPLTVGSVLKGRFVFEELIGRGGMGTVFKARDLRKEEAQDRHPYVAVKVLNESFKSHPESLKALQRESRKAQKLAHPNIVNVYDFDRDGSNVYMTMEYLVGEPLDHVIKKNRGQGFPEQEALAMVDDMGHALAYAHKNGIVHSDFKPGNAFLTSDGVVKVFDFGIARASKHTGQAQGEQTLFDAGDLGALTPAYASYEMLEGGEPDERDDIYALACVTYELLAGHHPFDKMPANQALEKKRVPAPVKGLGRRQWKGLLRGLAFKRDDRSPSVEAFLSDIARKRVQKGMLIAAAAAIVLVALLLATLLPDYLHKRRIAAIIAALKSGDTASINDTLSRVKTLPPDDQDEVTQEAKSELIAWHRGQLDASVDEAKGRYDYPAAEQVIQGALELYPDSAQIQGMKERLENRKNQLLNELNTRFNQYLEEGRLLPTPEDDIGDVLKVLAQVAPDHPLLGDPRLPAAYAEQTAHLYDAGDLEQATQMFTAGLQRYPQDVNLVNLRDKVKAEQLRRERETRIAGLQQQLQAALASMTSLDAIEAVHAETLELRELQPDAAILAKIQNVTRKQLDARLEQMISERSWDAGQTLLQAYADIANGEYLQNWQSRIVAAQQKHQQKLDSLYAALLESAAGRRLDAKSKNSAQQKLAELEASGADHALLDQGRAAIGQAYLELARAARAEARWEEARRHVQKGLQEQPGTTLTASLQAETTEITRAEAVEQQQLAQTEREARERQRQARIQQFQESFRQSLAKTPYDALAAGQSIRELDQLAAVNPADPLITQGRTEVTQQLVSQVTAFSAAGQWEQALALSREAVKVIPGSELLSTTLLDIERGRAQQLALQREQTVQQYKHSLAALLSAPELDKKWETQVRADLKGLGELLPAEDDWLPEQRSSIASLFLDRARQMRDGQRFTEAAGLLSRGRKFAPQDPAFEEESAILSKAEARFAEENKEKLRLARIEGNKQTLLTQAKANDVRSAKKTLGALRAELPANDTFITAAAPQALGDAYLRLAEGAAKKGKYESALKLARAGLDIAPELSALQRAGERYQFEIKVDKVRKQLSGVRVLNVRSVRQALDEIKTDNKERYPGIEQEFGGILYDRVRALAKSDYQSADNLLASAKELLPSHGRLAGLKIAPPVAKPERPPVAETKPVPPPVAKVTAPTTPMRTAGNCRPTLAGYGRRARGTCYDLLPGDDKGPLLVVIPAGDAIGQPYAISKYEISVSEYNRYCKASGECKGIRAKSRDLPVTGIAVKQAKAYAAWVGKQTGYTYRLPSEQEWVHAANAQGKQPGKDFNCRVLLGSQVIKGQALGSVKMGKSNGWGLKNYVGNAQEWVVTGSGLSARGGAYPDSLSKCSISLSRAHGGQADSITGFRLVRELEAGG